jgi:hypothetical protein
MRPLPPINRLESTIQVPSTTNAGAGSELRRMLDGQLVSGWVSRRFVRPTRTAAVVPTPSQ